jgi:hypothetical protein
VQYYKRHEEIKKSYLRDKEKAGKEKLISTYYFS